MRYWITIPIALVVIGVGSIAAAVLLNPLRRSESDIRGWLLHQAPLGSSRQEVMVLVARRGWKFHPEYRGRFINKSVPVGAVGAELGKYLGVRDVKVDDYWKEGFLDLTRRCSQPLLGVCFHFSRTKKGLLQEDPLPSAVADLVLVRRIP